MQSKTYYHSVT